MRGNGHLMSGDDPARPVLQNDRRATRRSVMTAATMSVAATMLAGVAQAGAQGQSTPGSDDPSTIAADLMATFAQMTMDKDVAGLGRLLADNFVIQRVVGAPIGKEAYLAALPEIGGFEILGVEAWQTDNVLIVSSSIQMDLILADGTQLSPEPTPYLTTGILLDGEWRVLAHANFGQVATEDAA